MVSIFFQFSFWSHKQFIQNQQISCKLYLFSPVQFHEKYKIYREKYDLKVMPNYNKKISGQYGFFIIRPYVKKYYN